VRVRVLGTANFGCLGVFPAAFIIRTLTVTFVRELYWYSGRREMIGKYMTLVSVEICMGSVELVS